MHAVSNNQIADILHFTNNYRYLTSKTKDEYQALNEHTVKGFKKCAINTYYEQTKLTAALEIIKCSGHIKQPEPIKWSEIDVKEDTANFYKPIPMDEFEKGELDKNRPFTANNWYRWYNLLISHIPESAEKFLGDDKEKIMKLFETNACNSKCI